MYGSAQVNKDDIAVRFFQYSGDNLSWDVRLESPQLNVHKQFAIVFTPPKYPNNDIIMPVDVSAPSNSKLGRFPLVH